MINKFLILVLRNLNQFDTTAILIVAYSAIFIVIAGRKRDLLLT